MAKSGIAVIITLTLIILVVSMVFNLASMSWIDISESTMFRDKMYSKIELISMLNYVMAVLSADKQTNEYDSFNDIWGDSKGLTERFKEWSNSEVEIVIFDEMAKLNINTLIKQNGEYNQGVQKAMLRLLKGPLFQLPEEQAQDILDSIKDWLDKDEEPTRFGAESSYYREQGLNYSSKNGSIDFLEELLMIKGVSESIFYGKEGRPGLKDFLRLKGPERVNINTAPKEILLALGDNVPEEGVEAMLSYRVQPGNDLSRPEWYRAVPGMRGVDLDSNMLTVKSDLFRAILSSKAPTKESRLIALIERAGKKVKVLEWKME